MTQPTPSTTTAVGALLRPRARRISAVLLTAAALSLAACTPTPAAPAGHEWSYDGESGPDHWGDAAPACADKGASEESPIDIITADMTTDATAPPLVLSYQPGAYTVKNNGHTIEAAPTAPNNVATLDGVDYLLQQFHLHAHSEHLIDSMATPAELHLVHASATGAVLVLGVLLEQGPANMTLDELFTRIPHSINHETTLTTPIDAVTLIPFASPSARYDGSLTTPPCTEGVQWNVFLEPMSISAEQLAAFTTLYPHNHRPPQPLHHRTVTEIAAG